MNDHSALIAIPNDLRCKDIYFSKFHQISVELYAYIQ